MRIFLSLALTVVSCFCSFSQSDPIPLPKSPKNHPYYKEGVQVLNRGDFKTSLPVWKYLIRRYPENADLYAYAAACEANLGDLESAYGHAFFASQLDPLDHYNYQTLGIISAMNDLTQARKYILLATEILSGDEQMRELLQGIKGYADFFASKNPTVAANYKTLYKEAEQYYAKTQANFYKTAYHAYQEVLKTTSVDVAVSQFASAKTYFTSDKQLSIDAYYYMVWQVVDNSVNPSEIPSLVKELVQGYNQVSNLYLKSKLFPYWAAHYDRNRDYEKLIAQANILIDEMGGKQVLPYAKIQMYTELCRYYNLAKKGDSRSIALQLIEFENEYVNPQIRLNIYTTICASLHESQNQADLQKAIVYGEKGLALAREQKLDDLGIKSALLTAYSTNHQSDKAMALQKEIQREVSDTEGQITTHSNQAILLLDEQKLEEAIVSFEKALTLVRQKLTTLSQAEKLPYMANRGKIFIDLASVYSALGKHEKVFQTLEEARNQYLAHSLGFATSKVATLAEVQASLAADEALIYYNWLASTGFLYTVVTKQSITSAINDAYFIFAPLKANLSAELKLIEMNMAQNEARAPSFRPSRPTDETVEFSQGDINIVLEYYRDMIQNSGKDEMIRTKAAAFSHMLYTAFMKPLTETLAGKKHLIFVLDGALNYIPFESFFDRQNNQLLVEKFDISYAPSGTVLRGLRAREYPATRKPILAMGGAIFQEGKNQSSSVRSTADIDRLREKVLDDISQGKSTLPAFRALGYDQLSYLEGTLQEVEDIRKQITGAAVFTGEQMQEEIIKELSATNKLQEYKVLHFATHGWVNNMIPQLSGIAFCTYPDGKNGQDGFLLLPEIAKLKCKADMVMLSACQTGLGKAYGSEGVYGLPQAFFVAGANSCIASLWPVDDAATSILGSQLYKLVAEKKIPYYKALNEVKRQFIRGEHNIDDRDFSAPVYWSPFIYNGK